MTNPTPPRTFPAINLPDSIASPRRPTILDNETETVVSHLRHSLRGARAFDFVSAYFTIYGYELLADDIEKIGLVRFLFGDPASVVQLDPGGQEAKSFDLTESGLEPSHVLRQKQLALRCTAWFRRATVKVRSAKKSNFLHGKLYLTDGSGGAVVGSSNFTRRGLGDGGQPNLEINVAVTDPSLLTDLREWFDRLWKDEGRTRDVKQEVLDSLARVGRDYSPEDVYYKTLYELFRKDIESMRAGEDELTATGFIASQVWNALYEFQKDGARSVIAKLRAYNGCILADSVGLGKTYTALAVIKYMELRNHRVLVICPKRLLGNWSLYQVANNHVQNPFPDDRFAFSLLAHTDLSRDSGTSNGVDFANFNWGVYDLVVIDESHNFRNDAGQRYQRLLEEVIKRGSQTKVLMLSATPVNTSLVDLRSQIYLMTEGREDAFRQSLGVGNIRSLMAAAQKQFENWESRPLAQRDKSDLFDHIGPDFLRLLDGVSISRSRRLVQQFYADEMERIGQFPDHEAPKNHYPSTDLGCELSYEETARGIEALKFSIYQPSTYLTDPIRLTELTKRRKQFNFNQQDSERFLAGMLRTNFLKRLESSSHSLAQTLRRTIAKIDNLLTRIDGHLSSDVSKEGNRAIESMPDDDEDDDEFVVNRGHTPYRLNELDLSRWQADLHTDKGKLEMILNRVDAVTPDRDGKLAELRSVVRRRTKRPTIDRNGKLNRKLLVFTTFKDTAEYLYDNLADLTAELEINMAMVCGGVSRTTVGPNDFNVILSNFAPVARNRRKSDHDQDVDLLIATDCISEGQNLQDCDTVLNYDIHWNPVRIVQRFGRIDRIGSSNASVRMVNFWPTSDLDVYLRLKSRVEARMALADMAASGDEDPFDETDAQLELNFRDEQLRRLREEALTLEELDDVPTLGDFTFDHFLAQLLRFLERNRDRLEAMPVGVYAVARSSDEPSVIFCLRQRNAGPVDSRSKVASPRHPFYFIQIGSNGEIWHGCASLQQTLDAFERATIGITEPIRELCDQFDSETRLGRDMSNYDQLLTHSISHITRSSAGAVQGGLGAGKSRDFLLAPASEVPQSARDFELLSWLVIRGRE